MAKATPMQRATMISLAVVALAALLLAGYLAFYRSNLPPGWLSLPVQTQEPEITLTREEAAALESKLAGLAWKMATGGCTIEKITKDADGYVMHLKTQDTILTLHVKPEAFGEASKPAVSPAP